MRRLAILRPEPGASLSATRAAEMGFDEIVTIPLFKVRPVEWTPPAPGRFDAILLTSANAARHVGDGLETLKRLPVHCVGEATANAARAAGMMIGQVGVAGVADLLATLPADMRLLHLCGQHRRMAEDAAQTIVPLPVYISAAREDPRDLGQLPGSVACVHSPRAGARLAELVAREGFDPSSIAIVAISAAAAAACGQGWEAVEIAEATHDSSLLALAKRLCQSDDDD